jgi:hypothetical protein
VTIHPPGDRRSARSAQLVSGPQRGPAEGVALSTDRTVTVTFPPGHPDDLLQLRIHVDGFHHGDAREAAGGGWEYIPAIGGRVIGYMSFWELLTALRQLPPSRGRPGLRVRVGEDERRAALANFAERGLTAGWPEYLAGWADHVDHVRQPDHAKAAAEGRA